LSRALFFWGPNPFHSSLYHSTRGSFRQISCVPSVLPESTTTISSAKTREARQSAICSSSFLVITIALMPLTGNHP